jgi:hypothetical protein
MRTILHLFYCLEVDIEIVGVGVVDMDWMTAPLRSVLLADPDKCEIELIDNIKQALEIPPIE